MSRDNVDSSKGGDSGLDILLREEVGQARKRLEESRAMLHKG